MSAPDILANMKRSWHRAPTSLALGTSSTTMSAALWTHNASDVQDISSDAPLSHHIISVHQKRHQVEVHKNGRLSFAAASSPPGAVQIMPIGVRPRAVWTGSWSVLHLYVSQELLQDVAQDLPSTGTIVLRDPQCAHDRVIDRLGSDVLAESRGGQPLSRLRIDVLGRDLAIQLVRHHSNLAGTRASRSEPTRGGLTPWQVRRVTECLEAHLPDDITLGALAALVELSPNHFCTAFRISLGEPPHRYLVRRRIERARELLANPRLTVTDIALAVGFGSSAHFATAFRKAVGVTPSRYRQEIS